jgi:hypothetical protein
MRVFFLILAFALHHDASDVFDAARTLRHGERAHSKHFASRRHFSIIEW